MKGPSAVVWVGLLLTLLSFALFVWGPPFVQAVSCYACDAVLRQGWRPPQTDAIAIVDLDDASLKRIGQWPWPRDRMAHLTRRLFAAGAAVLGFDILFAERDRSSPLVLQEKLAREYQALLPLEGLTEDQRDFDLQFRRALGEGKSVLGCMMLVAPTEGETGESVRAHPHYRERVIFRGVPGSRPSNPFDTLPCAARFLVPLPRFQEAAEVAFFNAEPDVDGVLRRQPLVFAVEKRRTYPALALEMLRLYQGATHAFVDCDEDGVLRVRVGSLTIPTDRNGRVLINYRRPCRNPLTHLPFPYPTYSAADVLEGKVDPKVFDGKLVLIGASAVGLWDLKVTPVASAFPGVQVHATLLDNMLTGDVLRVPRWSELVHTGCILVVGVLLTCVIARGRPWSSFVLTLSFVVLAMLFSVLCLKQYRLVFVPVWPLLTMAILYPVLTMMKYWEEERGKRRVRQMFGAMVSDDVLRYLERNPRSFSLSGRKAEVTVFFSDIVGFATISERLPPDRVSLLLNRYLTPMTEIILSRRGLVDKYEGDLIMAEWGVPFPLPDHAVQACLAAIEQQEKLDAIRPILQAEFGVVLQVRMGLNTGTVTAGNMGSDRRFQYTVLGDTVNQAARFEPANKEYGTRIIIGETTWEAARDAVEARLLDRIVVRGLTRPVTIYELLGRKGCLEEGKRKVVETYEQALRAYWERRWEEAQQLLTHIREWDPEDGPSRILTHRLERYRVNPPPPEWQGEFVRLTKD